MGSDPAGPRIAIRASATTAAIIAPQSIPLCFSDQGRSSGRQLPPHWHYGRQHRILSNSTPGTISDSPTRRTILTLSLEKYLSSVKRFHESVSELAAKLEEINNARAEALKASEDLRKELDATDNQMQDITVAVRQQIAAEFTKKVA